MTESEKDARSNMKPRSPLPWIRELDDTTSPQRRCRLIRSTDGPVVAYDLGIPEADYIVHACNSYPKLLELAAEKDAEITRLRERAALLESLLYEGLAQKYFDEAECSPRWLREAQKVVTDLDKFRDILTASRETKTL